MTRLTQTYFLASIVSFVAALYDSGSPVVELTEQNFKNKVINSDDVWIVEFYAPWCGHCKSLAPEYTKAAKGLKGIVNVGAVDMTQHQSVGAPYDVRGFPTIKVFGSNKNKPTDFNGQRTASALIDAGINELKKVANSRIGGGGGSSGGGSRGGQEQPKGNEKDVIELTDSNFEELVFGGDDMWLVEFFAPWCGHCKNLAPHWASAATQLKGKVKVAALDATVHTVMSNRFGIRGFPTIKMFPAGKKSASDAVDYDGGRTSGDIVTWALDKLAANVPPPEIVELTDDSVLKEACGEKQLCVMSFMPLLLDCQAECRNGYLKILRELGDKFKKNLWGWTWTEALSQPEIEEALGIGGFGYPAMAVVNARKGKFSVLKGPFTYDGIQEYLRDLSFGRGSTEPLRKSELPAAKSVPKWDGKDAEPPQEEDIDLDDVELDKIEL